MNQWLMRKLPFWRLIVDNLNPVNVIQGVGYALRVLPTVLSLGRNRGKGADAAGGDEGEFMLMATEGISIPMHVYQ